MTASSMETTVTEETKRKGGDLGPLHALLVKGLPDYIDENGVLESRRLAEYLGISYQALYASYGRKRMSRKNINAIVKLSHDSVKRAEDFEPLTHEKFWEFVR